MPTPPTLCLQVVGRHQVPLLDATWFIMMKLILTFHIQGTYEVEVSGRGEVRVMSGHPAPDFDGRGWKEIYIFHTADRLDVPVSADTVTEAITRVFLGAGVDAP